MPNATQGHSNKLLLVTENENEKLQGDEASLAGEASHGSEPAQQTLPEVQLFADGACSGNPGPGGYGFLIRDLSTGNIQEGSGAQLATTNNRMELLAVIRALESLDQPSSIELLTDSQYVGKGITEWMPSWKENNWRRRERNRLVQVKNEDLWRQLDHLLQRHRLRFTHVPGHSGHPENIRCDLLAVSASRSLLAINHQPHATA
jgi:ribonuclease HI